MTESYLSVGEVARQVGVSARTVQRWADSDTIPSHRLPSGARRIPASVVDKMRGKYE